ncbi:hypothetical protein CBF60_05180 [Lactobacillus taiwanensis]|uniref:hypothetical protein n=1 Tax=Lactobacillus taiwanensis TaxID=508451 RepID=UPI000B98649A|nr:hypothetical protein [Lactobacillus taiwanensis]OYS21810.1 hypothetical protein CBF76_00995 [Lactobacillus taiwanensis]OYS25065.1 hypothetical protein CBF66_03585 [Lactobacillus taiwanensis]OYS25568.1 hypothetical protein CBF73_05810 [Lactobacillus taiwanensis]OYS26114.1 hypothetical protein CBF55_00015 [Lactobacillus taiwanensis]OYS27759.1 hypothetical protein CBF60_05180 [Lactobacillus taiwanensis]
MEKEQKEKQLIFMKAASRYLKLMNLAVCSNCQHVVHDGNYCEQCGSKLVKINNKGRIEKKIHRCILCGENAQLKLSEDAWICETCAQIQGELSN